jgi:hypothetical protein
MNKNKQKIEKEKEIQKPKENKETTAVPPVRGLQRHNTIFCR